MAQRTFLDDVLEAEDTAAPAVPIAGAIPAKKPRTFLDDVMGTEDQEMTANVEEESLRIDRPGVIGTVSDVGQAALRGLGGAVETMAHAGRTVSPNDTIDTRLGAVISGAQKFQEFFPRSTQEQTSTPRRWLTEGTESAVQSIAAGAPGALVGGTLGGGIGAVPGFATSAGTIFGLAEYDQFMEEAKKYGVSDKDGVQAAAIKSALIEGGVEAATDLIAGKLFGAGVSTAKEAFKQSFYKGLKQTGKEFAKGYAKDIPFEVGGEMVQAGTESKLRRDVGIPAEEPWSAATSVIGPTLVSTGIIGAGARVGSHIYSPKTLPPIPTSPQDIDLSPNQQASKDFTPKPEAATQEDQDLLGFTAAYLEALESKPISEWTEQDKATHEILQAIPEGNAAMIREALPGLVKIVQEARAREVAGTVIPAEEAIPVAKAPIPTDHVVDLIQSATQPTATTRPGAPAVEPVPSGGAVPLTPPAVRPPITRKDGINLLSPEAPVSGLRVNLLRPQVRPEKANPALAEFVMERSPLNQGEIAPLVSPAPPVPTMATEEAISLRRPVAAASVVEAAVAPAQGRESVSYTAETAIDRLEKGKPGAKINKITINAGKNMLQEGDVESLEKHIIEGGMPVASVVSGLRQAIDLSGMSVAEKIGALKDLDFVERRLVSREGGVPRGQEGQGQGGRLLGPQVESGGAFQQETRPEEGAATTAPPVAPTAKKPPSSVKKMTAAEKTMRTLGIREGAMTNEQVAKRAADTSNPNQKWWANAAKARGLQVQEEKLLDVKSAVPTEGIAAKGSAGNGEEFSTRHRLATVALKSALRSNPRLSREAQEKINGIKPAHPAVSRKAEAEILALMAKVVGKSKNVFFVDSNGMFNGVKAVGNNIFVHVKATNPLFKVFAHEMLHADKDSHQKAILDTVWNTVDRKKFKKWRANRDELQDRAGLPKLNEAQAIEEFSADFLAEQMTDPAFWERLAKDRRGTFERLLSWIREKLTTLGVKVEPMGEYFTRPGAMAEVMQAAEDFVRARMESVLGVTKEDIAAFWPLPDQSPGKEGLQADNEKLSAAVDEALSRHGLGRDWTSEEMAQRAAEAGDERFSVKQGEENERQSQNGKRESLSDGKRLLESGGQSETSRSQEDEKVSARVSPEQKPYTLDWKAIAAKQIASHEAAKLETWQATPVTALDNIQRTTNDRHIDTLRVFEAIKKAYGQVSDALNFRQKETLAISKADKAQKDYIFKYVTPMLDIININKETLASVGEYAKNLHAEEVNEVVARRNPSFKGPGSGITTEDANAYLEAIPEERRKKLDDIMQYVRRAATETENMMVRYGLESQETIDLWRSMYPSYVPMNRVEADMQDGVEGTGAGKGFNIRGGESKVQHGSLLEVDNAQVLSNLIAKAHKTIMRGEKNHVGNAVYGAAVKFMNAGFWKAINPERVSKRRIAALLAEEQAIQNEIDSLGQLDLLTEENKGRTAELEKAREKNKKAIDRWHADRDELVKEMWKLGIPESDLKGLFDEEKECGLSPYTGQTVWRVNTTARQMPYVLATRFNGQDHFVFFNNREKTGRALEMAKALKNYDVDDLGFILSGASKYTRLFSQLSTQWNVFFGVVNATRDVQEALLNLTNTPLAGKQVDVIKRVAPAIRAIYRDLRARREGNDPDISNDYVKSFEEMAAHGGPTGFVTMLKNSEERAKSLEAEFKALSDGTTLRKLKGIRDWVSDYNEAMENGTRLSVYMTARENGLNAEEAAVIAKEITINFNRKGQIASQAGALYAFFNAAMQGTATMARTLAGPAGKRIILGGLAFGSMQAVMLAAAGYDDEEPPDFVKQRNVIIPWGDKGKNYTMIPMPLGFAVIPSLGRMLTEQVMVGGKGAGKLFTKTFGLLADTFIPVGGGGNPSTLAKGVINTAAFTSIRPIASLAMNEDYTGRPVFRTDYGFLRRTPGFTRTKDSASALGKVVAELANWASGGTQNTPGFFSPTPDAFDFLVSQYAGGVGREAMKTITTVETVAKGEMPPSYKIPLMGRFWGTGTGPAAIRNRFYENLRKSYEHKAEIEGKAQRQEDIAGYIAKNPEAPAYKTAMAFEGKVKKLADGKRKMNEAGKHVFDEIMNQQILATMTEFNKQFDTLRKKK